MGEPHESWRGMVVDCASDSGAAAEARHTDAPPVDVHWYQWTVGGAFPGDPVGYRVRGTTIVHPACEALSLLPEPFVSDPEARLREADTMMPSVMLGCARTYRAGGLAAAQVAIRERLSACAVAWVRDELAPSPHG